MEAVPRLPMLKFELKTSPDKVQFGPALKQYISSFYNEDPESYNKEVESLETLRNLAVRPTIDVTGCQYLKKYYCQLHFLKSRFPMSDGQPAAVLCTWKDGYAQAPCSVADISFELMCVLYNIGALHTKLGALDSRTSAEGMKMACTHFQCAAWAFQTIKENHHLIVSYLLSVNLIHFMQQICLAQAQECILEKSMMDNRKATIIAKVAVQVVDFYKRALSVLQHNDDPASFTDIIGSSTYKDWLKYVNFKVSYHKSIALLFQGQQAEEQQKMGERVAFYQSACDQLDEARKLATSIKNHAKDLSEAIAFTSDVVEGKRKAAKNENEFIYHEEVPERSALQEVKGTALVKGIPFSVSDLEVSGPDIFARLVPMATHEAASLYSEKKAQLLRQMGELVETKDQELAEFMSSLQLDVFSQIKQNTGLPQDLVDRAAALSARPNASKELVNAMSKLSNSYQEVETMLNDIAELVKNEEVTEKEYQEQMGKRAPSILATDLAREAAKYREAHSKANDSNQNLHKAMMTHVANLKILGQPLAQLQQQIPSIDLLNPSIDAASMSEIEILIRKVDEMRNQRAMLWNQFRQSVHADDITSVLVTRQPDQSLEQLFDNQLEKHHETTKLLEQNIIAQDNILKAFVDAYANSATTRRYLQDIIYKRNSTVSALIASFDSFEDLLAKANKGIEFYGKLETNVSKLLQRIKSTAKVNQEEREQFLQKNTVPAVVPASSGPKLKDFLDTRKKNPRVSDQYYAGMQPETQIWPPAVRPNPVGSEINEALPNYGYDQYMAGKIDQNLAERFANLSTSKVDYYQGYTNYTPGQYQSNNYPTSVSAGPAQSNNNVKAAPTVTTDMYQTISSSTSQIDQNQGTQQAYPSYSNAPTTMVQNNHYSTTGENMYPNYGAQQPYQAPSTLYQNYQAVYQNLPEEQQKAEPTVSYQNYAPNEPPSISSYQNYPSQGYQSVGPPQPYQGYSTDLSHPYPVPIQDYTSSTQGYPVPSTTYQPYTQLSQIPVSQYDPSVYQGNNVYFPPNYGPAAVATSTVASTYPASPFGSIEYATSVNQSHPLSTYPPTYSSPTVDLKSSNSVVNYDATQAQQPYPVYDYYAGTYAQNQAYSGYDYNYGVQTSEPTPVTVIAAPAVTTSTVSTTASTPSIRESNIDLLTGLDFTMGQAPLIPQQKSNLPAKHEAEEVASKPEVALQGNVKIERKVLHNEEVRRLFEQEVDKFEKFVTTLPITTLSGFTNLDLKWKEIQDKFKFDRKFTTIAQAHIMKNRFPDILPYDCSRVELKSTSDDYINASYIRNLPDYAAPLIVTQAPLSSTFIDFWTMVYEQNVELIVCLLNDLEICNEIYWPMEKGKDLTLGSMVISLVNITVNSSWTERLISILFPEKRESRVVMQLQFTAWPGSMFPSQADDFTNFTLQLIKLFHQQRNTENPILVHCSTGIGRSGLFSLLITSLLEVTNNPVVLPDLVALSIKLCGSRRNILRDQKHLKFAYEAFLAYMRQIVPRVMRESKEDEIDEDMRDEILGLHDGDNFDPLSSLDPFWASKK